MRFARFLLVLFTAILPALAAQPAAAQVQTDPYVSCVKCHALPGRLARADIAAHGYGAPPTPEVACGFCHYTWDHEQNPQLPPASPFFLVPGGPGSLVTGACLGCHSTRVPAFPDPQQHAGAFSHANDVFPYFDATPPQNPPLTSPPTSVLPLFADWGMPDQMGGGLVCSTCHDPHDPSYPVSGHDSFLRIGSSTAASMLCNFCHEPVPPEPPSWTVGYDLFIDSRSDSVRFERGPHQDLIISVTVTNRGNGYFTGGNIYGRWTDSSGFGYVPLPYGYIPPLDQSQGAVVTIPWTPPPDWVYGEGFFVFELPPRPLLPDSYFPVEFVRAMEVTPPPANVRVTSAAPMDIALAWDPPVNPPVDLGYDVYRDGFKITPWPIPYGQTSFTDGGLAPETPHVYTVVAVRMSGGPSSLPSAPAAGTTARGMTIRVPQNHATIQAAINAAGPGTTVLVAPGTYAEQLTFSGKQGVTLRGQDANGCALDYTGSQYPSVIDLTPDARGNTLAGFTVRGAQIMMGAGDVVTESVLVPHPQYAGPSVFGGGLVAQCVFDTPFGPAVDVWPESFLTSVNSVYLGAQPPIASGGGDASTVAALYNNDFPNWWDWNLYSGSGNFSDVPLFRSPGQPLSYLTDPNSSTVGRGLQLAFPPDPISPDVGAFQAWEPYTPQPPKDLFAAYDPGTRSIRLDWVPSFNDVPGDPSQMQSYLVFRSESPTFPPATQATAYDMLPAGTNWYEDANLAPGVTYYYQVRAFNGISGPDATELMSGPTNTASAMYANNPPVAVNDSLTVPEDMGGVVDVLLNDTDLDNDPLVVTAVGQPQHGTALIDGGLVEYVPAPDFFGTDSFSYTVEDGAGGAATAAVTVTVTPVNDPPAAVDDAYSTPEDAAFIVIVPGVLGNDTDPDGDALRAELIAGPAHGTLVLGQLGDFSYTPAADFNGTDSFTYRASDGLLGSAPATVTITVSSLNDPPVANAGADQTGTVGQVLSFSGAASADIDGTIAGYAWNWGDGTAGGSGAAATHAFAAPGTFTVTLTVTDDGGATATDTLVVTVPEVNLALDTPAAASSSRKGSTYTPAKAVDGSTATSWLSAHTRSPQWVRVDLGVSQSISKVRVVWPETYFATTFSIQYSANGKQWYGVLPDAISGNGAPSVVTFGAINARYVRVYCETPNNTAYYGVAEFEVYR